MLLASEPHISDKRLSCSVFPELLDYEKKINILKTDIPSVLNGIQSIPTTELIQLSANKIEHLRNYYKKGLIRKDLFRYYMYEDDSM